MIHAREEILKTISALEKITQDQSLYNKIEAISDICVSVLKNGKKILFCGNGGSAADSQHLAAELVSRLNFDRNGLAAIALTTDTSSLTAIGNDYGFDKIFSRQIEAIGNPGDVLIAISTSGNSLNILNAIESARTKDMTVIGLTGKTGGKMANQCYLILQMPSNSTQKIQECHIVIGHIFCGMIEERIFG